MVADDPQQRAIAIAALSVLAEDGFVLAGAGAIREHGLTSRPTKDLDLFTAELSVPRFEAAVSRLVDVLRSLDFQVRPIRRGEGFAQLEVEGPAGDITPIDLGIDYRNDPPAQLEIGPVLSLEDAVANKVAALFSRSLVRDFLDVDSIRRSGAFTDEELIELGGRVDAGFDEGVFVHCLRSVARFEPGDVAPYGLDDRELDDVKRRTMKWATTLESK